VQLVAELSVNCDCRCSTAGSTAGRPGRERAWLRLLSYSRRSPGTCCAPVPAAGSRCSLGDDQLWGAPRLRKGGDHTLAALKSIRAARPDGAPIYAIMDNLSANKTPVIRIWAKKHKVRLRMPELAIGTRNLHVRCIVGV
jgi:hypothetical protein